MKEQYIGKINGRIVVRFIHEHWWDWVRIEVGGFLVKIPREGEELPRFYIPVFRREYRDSYDCWIFPLAPFALFVVISYRVFWIIWKDLILFADYLRLWIKTKKKAGQDK